MNLHSPLRLPSIACVILALAACNNEPKAAATGSSSTTPAPKAAAPKAAAASAPQAPVAAGPVAALNAMDPRTPVPLQPMMAWHQKQNMQQHLVAIQRITGGLAGKNWDEIARAASMIESSPQMQQMCQHMGAGAKGFTKLALEFHRRADAIGVAARAHDSVGVLRATSNTLKTCTGCHATFRQDVVDASTWQARTGSSHDPAAMHDKK